MGDKDKDKDTKLVKSTSGEWDKAVARARGQEITVDALANPSSLVIDKQRNLQDLLDAVSRGEAEIAEFFVTLEPGQSFDAQLLFEGLTELEDLAHKGTMRTMATWHFAHPNGLRFSIVGSAQLDRGLRPLLGRRGLTFVKNTGKSTKKTKSGFTMTEYTIIGPPASAPRLLKAGEPEPKKEEPKVETTEQPAQG